MKIGIIGNGFVGKATSLLSTNALIHDIIPTRCRPIGTTITDIISCEFIFLCVPTPVTMIGNCYLEEIEKIIEELRRRRFPGHIVIRSTVPPGTCDRLKVHYMPEFLTEKNWYDDFKRETPRIIGVNSDSSSEEFKRNVIELFEQAKSEGYIDNATLKFAKTTETEITKYGRNAFLAVKVAFFNEIYRFCKAMNVNFEPVREMITVDERINFSHSKVPGHNETYGFDGTCLPKDLLAFINEYEKNDVKNYVMTAAAARNDKIDNPDGSWRKEPRSLLSSSSDCI